MKRKADFFLSLPEKKVQCMLCPHKCIIAPGQTGICKGRKNFDGILYAINYGKTVALAVDPVEKKPLYHFYPGKKLLSIGANGCNFACDFCQNYTISQKNAPTIDVSPQSLVELCHQSGAIGVAFTYTEPFIWYEFIKDSAPFLHENGLQVVVVTNGMVCETPLRRLLPFIDAFNIDLKAFSAHFYQQHCMGDIETVKQTIMIAAEKSHVEITTLLIPGLNDAPAEITNIAKCIASINTAIPLHISRYFPAYKSAQTITPFSTLMQAYKRAKKYLDYVYIGNVRQKKYAHTYCPNCHNLLINRSQIYTKVIGIDQENSCVHCKQHIPGIHLYD